MPTQYSTLRIAAASVATGVLTVGSALPVYAAGNGGHHAAGHQASAVHRHGAGKPAPASRGSEHRSARASSHGTATPSRHASSSTAEAAPQSRRTRATKAPTPRSKAQESHGRANPPRHTPVTVCHLLGNGSYHLLTMDDSALKAHVGHDDLYPVPDGGCPTASSLESETPETLAPASVEATEVLPTSPTALAQVLGIQRELLTQLGLSSSVLGVQLERTANRAPAQVAPMRATTRSVRAQVAGVEAATAAAAPTTGVLPQTGAGQVATTLAAGLGLLMAGAGLLSRRRLHATR